MPSIAKIQLLQFLEWNGIISCYTLTFIAMISWLGMQEGDGHIMNNGR